MSDDDVTRWLDRLADGDPQAAERIWNCYCHQLAALARLRLEGYTNKEIARSLDCVEATVERKVARIRQKWSTAVER